MRSDAVNFAKGFLAAALIAVIVFAIVGCTRTFVPGGKPGCPERQRWSDSAQKCVPRGAP